MSSASPGIPAREDVPSLTYVYVGHKLPENISLDDLIHHFQALKRHIDADHSTIVERPKNRFAKIAFTSIGAAEACCKNYNQLEVHSFKITVNTWTGNEKQNKAKSPLPALQTSDTGGQKTDMKAFFGVLGVQPSDDSSEAEEESSEDEDSDTSSQASSHASNMTQPKKSYVAYVGQSLPDGITTGNIYNHFKAIHGSIKPKSVRVFYAKNKNRIAKISFTSPEALARAISQYNNTILNGYTISVQKWGERPSKPISPAKSKQPKTRKKKKKESSSGKTDPTEATVIPSSQDGWPTAYIGYNLPETISISDLERHFNSIKSRILPDSVKIHTTKKNTRFGKVAFFSSDILEEAISQFNKTKIKGYVIVVKKWNSAESNRDPKTESDTLMPHPSSSHPSGPHPSVPQPLPPAYPNYDPPPAYDDSFHSPNVGQSQGLQGQYPPLQGHFSGPQGQFSGPQGQYPVPRVPPTGPTRPMFAQSPQNRLQGPHYPGSGFQPPPDFHSVPSSQRPESHLGQFPPGTIHSQSPTDPQHSKKKKKSNNRSKSTASKPKGPSRHDPGLAVIIRNINSSISEDQLADIIKEFLPKVESVFLHECQNEPNYAHVNCLTEQDARLLVDRINGRKYSGLYVFASLQKDGARKPSKADEASDTASNYSESSASSRKQFAQGGSSASVKLHNLGKSISVTRLKKEIHGISGVLFTKIITTKYTYNFAYVNCTSLEAANNVAKHLSGRELEGVRIRTQILTKSSPRVSSPTRNISERFTKEKQMSEWLYKFFMERFEREIREAMEKGLTLDFKDEILLVGGSDDLVDPFFDNYISQVSDVSLSLTASQWNQLVTVKEETGQSLYQDLLRPYKGNPNIHIEKRESPFTLIIVGVQVAVESARECFMEKLDKKIAVDRTKLFVLIQLCPDLCEELEDECGINVLGFEEGCSEITLSGNGDVNRARLKITVKLDAIVLKPEKITLPSCLIPVALKWISDANFQVVMYCDSGKFPRLPNIASSQKGNINVKLAGLNRKQLKQVHKALLSPVTETLALTASLSATLKDDVDYNSKSLEEEHNVSIMVDTRQNEIAIQGFCKTSVRKVCDILRSTSQPTLKTTKTAPLECTAEQRYFLEEILIKNPSNQGSEIQALLEVLGVELKLSKGQALLIGPETSIESAASAIRQNGLLKILADQSFEYTVSQKNLMQDLNGLVQELKDNYDVTLVLSSQTKRDPETKKKDFHVRVHVYCTNKEARADFDSVCDQLNEVEPISKRLIVTAEEAKKTKEALIQDVEKHHSVHVTFNKENRILNMQGLLPANVINAFRHFQEYYKMHVLVNESIPVNVAQIKFLESKRSADLQDIRRECNVKLPCIGEQTDLKVDKDIFIILKGSSEAVSRSYQRIAKIINDLQVEAISLEIDDQINYEWNQSWREAVKMEVEGECDIVITFPRGLHQTLPISRSYSHNSSLGSHVYDLSCTLSFVDPNEREIAKRILHECITMRSSSLEASDDECQRARTALREGSIDAGLVHVEVWPDSNLLILSTPLRFQEQLADVEVRLKEFLFDKKPEMEEWIPLEGSLQQLIGSRLRQAFSKQGVNLSFQSDKVGFFGRTVNAVKGRIAETVAKFKSNICQEDMPVDRLYQAALLSHKMKSLVVSLQKKNYVTITLPTQGGSDSKTNLVKWELKGLPQGWPSQCTIQLVQGDLTLESTDAVVNAANEDLKLYSGVAAALLQAGGNGIQEECDEFISKCGTVYAGNAVCLGSGTLPCKCLIHAVGPKYTGRMKPEDAFYLEETHFRTFDVAILNDCRSVSFPSLSTGKDICSKAESAECAKNALLRLFRSKLNMLTLIKFVFTQGEDCAIFKQAFSTIPETFPVMKPSCVQSLMQNQDRAVIEIKGCKEDVEIAKFEIEKFFKNGLKSEQVQYPAYLHAKVEGKILSFCQSLAVDVSFSRPTLDHIITAQMTGWHTVVPKAKEYVTGWLLKQ